MRTRIILITLTCKFLQVIRPAAAADISEAQAREFAKEIEYALTHAHRNELDSMIDSDAIEGSAKDGKERMSVGNFIVSVFPGEYRFLRVTGSAAHQKILMRYVGRSGLDYWELELNTDSAGQIQVHDIYCFMPCMGLSQWFHYAARASTRPAAPDVGSLPVGQSEKARLLRQLSDSQAVGDPAYAAELAEFQKRFPDDPSPMLLSLFPLLRAHQYAQYLTNVDKLDHILGGDPYLNALRARALIGLKDSKGARAMLEKGFDSRMSPMNIYTPLIEISLRREDFEETARVLKLMDKKGPRLPDDLGNEAPYRDFMQSDAYKKWVSERNVTSNPVK